jgi:hypothetical protein
LERGWSISPRMIHGVGARMPCFSVRCSMVKRMLDLAEFALWLVLAAVACWAYRLLEP